MGSRSIKVLSCPDNVGAPRLGDSRVNNGFLSDWRSFGRGRRCCRFLLASDGFLLRTRLRREVGLPAREWAGGFGLELVEPVTFADRPLQREILQGNRVRYQTCSHSWKYDRQSALIQRNSMNRGHFILVTLCLAEVVTGLHRIVVSKYTGLVNSFGRIRGAYWAISEKGMEVSRK